MDFKNLQQETTKGTLWPLREILLSQNLNREICFFYGRFDYK